jgi:multiple sugar transport system substrate-binding protein
MKRNALKLALTMVLILSVTVLPVTFAAKPKTVIHWMEWKGAELGMAPLIKLKTEFEKQNPDVELEIMDAPFSGVHDKLFTLAQAGKLPEITLMQMPWPGEFSAAKMIIPLDPFIKKEPANFLNQYYDGYKRTIHGKHYGLPIHGGCVCLFYNTKIFREDGITAPPKTWDELVKVAQKVNKPEKNQYAFTCTLQTEPPTNANYDIYPLFYQAGAQIVNKKDKAIFNSPQGVKAIEFYASLVNKYKISVPGVLSNGEKEKRANFAAGNVAMMYDGTWGVNIQKQLNPKNEFAVAPMPVGTAAGTFVGGSLLGITPSAAKDKKKLNAAWRFIKFATGPDGNEIFCSASGDMPGNKIAASRPFVRNNKMMQPFLEQMEKSGGCALPHLPRMTELNKIMTVEVQNVILGKKTAKKALDDAAAQWNAIISGK